MEKLSRDKFKYYINFIKDRVKFEEKFNRLISKEFTDSTFYIYPKYEVEFIHLLEYIMDDKANWIQYFIYELDFGKKWNPNTVTAIDGTTDIPLATIDNLYDILVK